MKCEEVRELLPEYLDAELHEAAEIDAHLATCRKCPEILASYRATLAELDELTASDPAAPEGLVARVLAQIPEQSTAARLRATAREHPVAVAAGIGGAAIAAIATVYAIKRSRRDELVEATA
jgi:anti-sigma factor RsiW